MLEYYGIPDSIEARLAAYNCGIGRLNKVYNTYGEKWKSYLPRETREYLMKYREG